MMKAFNTLVRPANDELARMLGITPKYDEDYTVIPVRVKFAGGTEQILEDGMVTECNHAGADLGKVDLANLIYNPATEQVEEFDNSHIGLVCDQCNAWQDVTGEWHE